MPSATSCPGLCSFEGIVCSAEALAIGWIVECATILTFDDVVTDHPVAVGC